MKNLYQSKSKIIQYDGKIKKTLKNEEILYKIKKTKKTTFLFAKTAVRCYSYTFMTGSKKM